MIFNLDKGTTQVKKLDYEEEESFTRWIIKNSVFLKGD